MTRSQLAVDLLYLKKKKEANFLFLMGSCCYLLHGKLIRTSLWTLKHYFSHVERQNGRFQV